MCVCVLLYVSVCLCSVAVCLSVCLPLSVCVAVCLCLSVLQFAQFALLTQTLSVFGAYILQFIGSHKVKVIIVGQLVSCVSFSFLSNGE